MQQQSLMSHNSIKYTLRCRNEKAFTIVEILVATLIGLSLIGAVASVYILSNKTYSIGVARQWLQDETNIILTKIIEGKQEPGGVVRLCEAVSYNIVNISELHFTGTDSTERWFRLNNSSTSLIYHHPTTSGNVDETIYTAPIGVTITLRFSIPSGAQYTGVVVGIDVALTNTISGRTVSSSASTYVNIRNHST